jgi:ABC-type cobalamin/Fe3+-siderophores transport system ATPase subunit
MAWASLTIKNYRTFPRERPARIDVRPGFSALVGANNAGKSSLLKLFYEFRDLFRTAAPGANLVAAIHGQSGFQLMPAVRETADLFSNRNNGDIELGIRIMEPVADRGVPPAVELGITVPRNQNVWTARVTTGAGPIDFVEVRDDFAFDGTGAKLADLTSLAEVLSDLASTTYIPAFRNAINVGAANSYYDIQTGEQFITAWRAYKTGPTRLRRRRAAQVEDTLAEIFGYDRLQINGSDDNRTLIVQTERDSYDLSELGSGLTQFLLGLINAALQEPAYVLIDEPEMGLHPSLQQTFLKSLAENARRGVVFATHSLGLARAIAQPIYSLRRIEEGDTEVVPYEQTPRLAEFVGELSFSGQRELGFEILMLVEGPSEVLAIQDLLRLYGQDHRVVLVSLGGRNLINAKAEPQLLEVKRICDRTLAFIDSERAAKNAPLGPARQGFVAACLAAGIECKVMDRRALENYFSARAIRQVYGPKYRALGKYELLEDAEYGWPKTDNWRIARAITIDDLKGTDIGKFLAAL